MQQTAENVPAGHRAFLQAVALLKPKAGTRIAIAYREFSLFRRAEGPLDARVGWD
ncbi:MAG: hypothetical protein NTZ26_13580 [Candidatus Aminicenantes bacterium]|nr:hypothetical protein [Candidatus Aminicenantes bacterium]